MSDVDQKFFSGKRPWSVIKDKVLGDYMTAYLAKVARLGKPILLIDGYAGPGIFDDHSPGSPLIMCAAAEKVAKGKYTALFVNHNPKHHTKLNEILGRQGRLSSAIPILGDSTSLLAQLSNLLRDQTVFLYLDPYGLRGCEFDTLQPFLTRDKRHSTEIVINMSMPITHRLAAPRATAEGHGAKQKITRFHQRLTAVFGGEYWKDIFWASGKSAEEKEVAVMAEYRRLISNYLPYTGSCPVREAEGTRVKYFITFASRHPDAMLLMNDAMCKAYFGEMHRAEYEDTLFANTDWTKMRDPARLEAVVLQSVKQYPGHTREHIWQIIVQEHFMQFTASEYKVAVTTLFKRGKISSPTERPTSRLNDSCELYLSDT